MNSMAIMAIKSPPSSCPARMAWTKMQSVMAALRANPPKAFAGEKVAALRDYLKPASRTTVSGAAEALTLPKSNVLYFELEGRRLDLRASQQALNPRSSCTSTP